MLKKFANDKHYREIRDHCYFTGKYRGVAHSIRNLRFKVSNEIPLTFQSSSNYGHHFIKKELANGFEEQFECLGEKTEEYKPFPVPKDKEITNIDKDANESVVTISCKI